MLEDLTVLELSSVLSGPAVGMFLAELGARVIKVENPKTVGDITRGWKLPSEDSENDISSYFSSVNWGKESIGLDIYQHKKLIKELIKKSDIVIQNYKPGVAINTGLDYESVYTTKKEIIYAEIKAYEREERLGFDAIIQAESGFTFLNGDDKPQKMPVALMDLLAAHQIKEGILLALLRKEKTGVGSYISSSLFGSGVSSLANQATNWLNTGELPKSMGSEHPNIAPYGSIYRTSDNKAVVLAVGTEKQFEALREALELAPDERFSTNQKRVSNREALKALIQAKIEKLGRTELVELLHKKGIPVGAINNMEEVFSHPEAKSKVIDVDGIKGVRSVSFVMDSLNAKRELSSPPHYNQHGMKILTGDLGLSEADAAGIFSSQ